MFESLVVVGCAVASLLELAMADRRVSGNGAVVKWLTRQPAKLFSEGANPSRTSNPMPARMLAGLSEW